jgi:predicted regulator of Ras-like GTPase activity (Roadblock/LC7/MglB family)
MCKELGFDSSRETYIKGERNIVIILDLKKEYQLVIMIEMNALKCEFFDCD